MGASIASIITEEIYNNIKTGDNLLYAGNSSSSFSKGKLYEVLGFYDGVYKNDKYGITIKGDNDICQVCKSNIMEDFVLICDLNDDVDNVNHPKHYTSHPSGVECITITRHYCFSIGNAIKYLWRAGLKKDASLEDKQKEIEDLEKAIFYIKDRIAQIEGKYDKDK